MKKIIFALAIASSMIAAQGALAKEKHHGKKAHAKHEKKAKKEAAAPAAPATNETTPPPAVNETAPPPVEGN